MRADARNRWAFLHRAAVFRIRSDPDIRRSSPGCDSDCHVSGSDVGAASRCFAGAERSEVSNGNRRRGLRRGRAATFLVCRPNGELSRALQRARRFGCRGLGLVYANLQPRYRLADQVPDGEQALAASHRLDAKLNGANPIDVLIEVPQGKSLYDPETLAAIAEVHATVEKQPGIANVWSLEALRRWLAEKMGKSDVATLKEYVHILTEYLTRRFVSAEQDAVLVSGRVPDVDASQLLPVIESFDKHWMPCAQSSRATK
jgi:hypothetical protein